MFACAKSSRHFRKQIERTNVYAVNHYVLQAHVFTFTVHLMNLFCAYDAQQFEACIRYIHVRLVKS